MREVRAEVFGDGLADIADRAAHAEIDAGVDLGTEGEQRHILAAVIGGGRGGVAAVVGGGSSWTAGRRFGRASGTPTNWWVPGESQRRDSHRFIGASGRGQLAVPPIRVGT